MAPLFRTSFFHAACPLRLSGLNVPITFRLFQGGAAIHLDDRCHSRLDAA